MLRSPSRFVRSWITAALVGSVLAGCGSSTEPASEKAAAAGPKTDVTVEPIKATRELTDTGGVKLSLKEEPKSIVCLFALCDDILTELGIVPTATNSVLLAQPGFLGRRRRRRPTSSPAASSRPRWRRSSPTSPIS